MNILFRGNFSVPFSTESHVAASLRELGHHVIRMPEGEASWQDTYDQSFNADLFLWTQTFALAHRWSERDARETLRTLGELMPTVGFHLDLWFGLERVHQLSEEPFFDVQHLFTADGDHDQDFEALGINHHWLPPAVYRAECNLGTYRRQYASDIAFVGNHRWYHDEWWPQRKAVLTFLRRNYGRRVRFWPERQAIRGQDLNDLYASAKIIVGDSCFADRAQRYFSDRAFETVGRGGFLIMPHIPALAEMLIDGEHVRYYSHGDFRELSRLIGHYLRNDDERERIRAQGMAHVKANHTYTNRMQSMLQTLAMDKAVSA